MRKIAIMAVLTLGMVLVSQTAGAWIRVAGRYDQPMHGALKPMSKNKLMLSTMHLLNGELRLEYERELANPNNLLIVSASGIYKRPLGLTEDDGHYRYFEHYTSFNSGFESYNQLWSVGVGAGYKHHFTPELYYAGLIHYNYYNVGYQHSGYSMVKFREDGLDKYVYQYRNEQISGHVFNKFSGNVIVGIQSPRTTGLVFDFYLGLGYSHSFYDNSKHDFNEFLGFGYRDFYPVMGFKVGIPIGK